MDDPRRLQAIELARNGLRTQLPTVLTYLEALLTAFDEGSWTPAERTRTAKRSLGVLSALERASTPGEMRALALDARRQLERGKPREATATLRLWRKEATRAGLVSRRKVRRPAAPRRSSS